MEDYFISDNNMNYSINVRNYYLGAEYNSTTDKLVDFYNETYFGPFNDGLNEQLNNFIDKISSFTIEFTIRNEIPEQAPASANCYLWSIL